jgi:hypothetical protein
MVDITKKYKTRDGIDVELISDKGRGEYPIIGFIHDDEYVKTWTKDGVFNIGIILNHLDIVEVKEKKSAYLNVYQNTVAAHDSKCLADNHAYETRIACVRVEYEEGQFDE